ncbi:AzlC family ABC transporter permease [Dactylosporangium sp. CA-152071]|uniref:AzlC family ABC transporter permease n=1 Tax=Dactylosporangium sp. CA-152071 TaxID=3239933 RepID=UPI003D8C2150
MGMSSAARITVQAGRPPMPSPVVAAVKDSLPVGLGLAPLGVAFGMLIVQTGLSWWWATVFTAVIYAGSFEFLLIGLVTAAAPLATIATTAFLVNVRHLFYALSFPLHRVRGVGKVYGTFALTDEAYALTTTEQAQTWPGRRILALQLFLQMYWVAGATLGGLLGSRVPDGVTGLDFALTALFVVLAIEAIRAGRDIPSPVLALLAAVIAGLLSPEQMMLTAVTLFTAALMVRRFVAARRSARA